MVGGADHGDSALPPGFYARPAARVARDLLGRFLISAVGGTPCGGQIVETEAYEGLDDPASHAWSRTGRTARNDPLFGIPGTAYIHLNYGIHWCLNAVTDAEDEPGGVLIRAIDPVWGLEIMRERRGRDDLTSGPGKLTRALGIGPELQRHRLDTLPVWIGRGTPTPETEVERTTRIGISRGADRPLRFYDRRSRWVSHR